MELGGLLDIHIEPLDQLFPHVKSQVSHHWQEVSNEFCAKTRRICNNIWLRLSGMAVPSRTRVTREFLRMMLWRIYIVVFDFIKTRIQSVLQWALCILAEFWISRLYDILGCFFLLKRSFATWNFSFCIVILFLLLDSASPCFAEISDQPYKKVAAASVSRLRLLIRLQFIRHSELSENKASN